MTNPVAPKTDTPATEDFGCPRCSIGTAIFGDSCIVCVGIPDAHAALIKEIQAKRAQAESTLAAERASRDQLHAKFGFVPAADDPKKCACAYCVKDFEAIADMCAEYECAIELDGGYKDQVRQLRASRLQAEEAGWQAAVEASALIAERATTRKTAIRGIKTLAPKPSVSPEPKGDVNDR